jgi:hypothetical protein
MRAHGRKRLGNSTPNSRQDVNARWASVSNGKYSSKMRSAISRASFSWYKWEVRLRSCSICSRRLGSLIQRNPFPANRRLQLRRGFTPIHYVGWEKSQRPIGRLGDKTEPCPPLGRRKFKRNVEIGIPASIAPRPGSEENHTVGRYRPDALVDQPPYTCRKRRKHVRYSPVAWNAANSPPEKCSIKSQAPRGSLAYVNLSGGTMSATDGRGFPLFIVRPQPGQHAVVFQRRRVADGLPARRDVAQQSSHDLAAAGLGQGG